MNNWNRKEALPEGYRLYTNPEDFEKLITRQAANDNSDNYSSKGAPCHLVNGIWDTKKRTVIKLVTAERSAREALSAAARASERRGARFTTTDPINLHTPEERAAGRVRAKESREYDAAAMRPFLQLIHVRQNIGDPSCPQSVYDENEQHRILAERVEDYLAPIYQSEASYVVPLLSSEYPKKIWTKFESDQFKGRFGQNAVIPIRYRSSQDGYFTDASEYGSLAFNPSANEDMEVTGIVETICRRLEEDRTNNVEPSES